MTPAIQLYDHLTLEIEQRIQQPNQLMHMSHRYNTESNTIRMGESLWGYVTCQVVDALVSYTLSDDF